MARTHFFFEDGDGDVVSVSDTDDPLIQYDQKMVRLISRSNTFPDTAAVICANVRTGGEHTRITLTMTKTGLLNELG